VNRPLVAILALILALCVLSGSNAFAKPLPDGARGRGILRLQGGTLFRDRGYTDGNGWLAGGSLGVGVTRDVLVLASIEHIDVRRFQPNSESFQPVTLQIEMGAPFQHRITPRVDVGAGAYLRTRNGPSYVNIHGLPTNTAPFGMNFGGGLSFLVTRTFTLDVSVRRHESFNSHEDFGMTSAGAGLTFALSRDEPATWAGTDPSALASR